MELFTSHGKNVAEVLADNDYAIYKGRRLQETPEGDDEKLEGDDEEANSKFVNF